MPWAATDVHPPVRCSVSFYDPEGYIDSTDYPPLPRHSFLECTYNVTVYTGYGVELQVRSVSGNHLGSAPMFMLQYPSPLPRSSGFHFAAVYEMKSQKQYPTLLLLTLGRAWAIPCARAHARGEWEPPYLPHFPPLGSKGVSQCHPHPLHFGSNWHRQAAVLAVPLWRPVLRLGGMVGAAACPWLRGSAIMGKWPHAPEPPLALPGAGRFSSITF